MYLKTVFAMAAVFTIVPLTASDKPDFSGTWRVESQGSTSSPALKIEQKDQELRISSAESGHGTDVNCNTIGKQCEATVSGERVNVSYWYNGPTLVEMLSEGKNNGRVVKTRRTLSEDGRKMTVEVIHIVPPGKAPEKLVFVRTDEVAAAAELK